MSDDSPSAGSDPSLNDDLGDESDAGARTADVASPRDDDAPAPFPDGVATIGGFVTITLEPGSGSAPGGNGSLPEPGGESAHVTRRRAERPCLDCTGRAEPDGDRRLPEARTALSLATAPRVGALVVVAVVAALGGAGATLLASVALAAQPANAGLGPSAVATLGALAAGVLFLVGWLVYGEGYLAGLWIVAPFISGVAAAAAVAAYLLEPLDAAGRPDDPLAAVLAGVAAGGLVTAAGAFVCRSFARRDRAQMAMYARLKERYADLCIRYARLEEAEKVRADRAEQYETSLAGAYGHLRAAREELYGIEAGKPALRWMLATGYSGVVRSLHLAEADLVAAEPDDAVVGHALRDSLSLNGSTMADRDALHDYLVAAVQIVSTSSAAAFFPPSPAPHRAPSTRVGPSAVEARQVLREVRLAINAFRDDRIDGLIRARQRLVWTAVAVGLTTYVLLGLALLRGVPPLQMATAAAFYLIAAVVGLFNRLRIEAGRSRAVEDYGLYFARLVTAPLVSGLAGIAGVFLVAKAPQFLSVLSPGPGVPSTMTASDIFDVTRNDLGALVAAVFGLAPAQLAIALQHQADRLETDLEKSQPAGGSSLSPSDSGS